MDLGLSDAADVRYFRFPGLVYASEFPDPAVFLASLSLLVLWSFVLWSFAPCGWFWVYLGRFWTFGGSRISDACATKET